MRIYSPGLSTCGLAQFPTVSCAIWAKSFDAFLVAPEFSHGQGQKWLSQKVARNHRSHVPDFSRDEIVSPVRAMVTPARGLSRTAIAAQIERCYEMLGAID